MGGVFQIEEHVKRILFKLKDKSKVKEPLSYIKYGKDKQPNVKGRDDNHIDVKDYYRVESSLASIFDNSFMLLDCPSLQVSGNNGELGGVRPSPILLL